MSHVETPIVHVHKRLRFKLNCIARFDVSFEPERIQILPKVATTPSLASNHRKRQKVSVCFPTYISMQAKRNNKAYPLIRLPTWPSQPATS